ncbi:glycine zipper 2TM domain-containing protein [Paracoccus sp. CPCC 101403]|uniref:17 kDa surface antigen n=2 Tax=Paracoccus broussonetiae TaxID=3075834 RepID=A0ABU3E9K5_9RHOB|nr:glycine zipper 2TM domain-containing protein [Paracoccus sp. CPCC 101403]MDT1060904.1 glycine zipper 2TM domain-containing protein [Paracoccus sp. CPCC 101403]
MAGLIDTDRAKAEFGRATVAECGRASMKRDRQEIELIKAVIISLGAVLALAACNPTPQQQAAMRCGASTAGGAAVGAGLGSAIGGGKGRDIAMAAGALGGGAMGHRMGC